MQFRAKNQNQKSPNIKERCYLYDTFEIKHPL